MTDKHRWRDKQALKQTESNRLALSEMFNIDNYKCGVITNDGKTQINTKNGLDRIKVHVNKKR